MLKRAIAVCVIIGLLAGCSSPNTEKEKDTGNKVDEVEKVDKEALEKEQNGARNYFEEMLTAVENNDKTKFMSYQDESNELFYKEQEVWMKELIQRKNEGWEISVGINNITLESLDHGSLELKINMKLNDEDISNHITYPINKIDGKWKVNDLAFKKIVDGPINLYYLPFIENDAEVILADIKDLVNLYTETFGWEPEELNIKLYTSLEEISASTGWPHLYGVAVPFISLKFLVQGSYSESTYSLMKHEIVHMMFSDLANDNTPTFLQEGLATFVSTAVTKDNSGKPQLDFSKIAERESIILENMEEIKPIDNLKDLNYTDDDVDIYGMGFLITDYLIQTNGIEKYVDMTKILKKDEVVDSDNPDREKIVFERAIQALEETYGSLEELSSGYVDYFNNKQ